MSLDRTVSNGLMSACEHEEYDRDENLPTLKRPKKVRILCSLNSKDPFSFSEKEDQTFEHEEFDRDHPPNKVRILSSLNSKDPFSFSDNEDQNDLTFNTRIIRPYFSSTPRKESHINQDYIEHSEEQV
ncbi:uncharacterized protein [Mytilus edulis]|uniref:uncharacterized protein n=1 Tax=Mytilus edulis TaxID=6550 RepID=UPI0039EFD28A